MSVETSTPDEWVTSEVVGPFPTTTDLGGLPLTSDLSSIVSPITDTSTLLPITLTSKTTTQPLQTGAGESITGPPTVNTTSIDHSAISSSFAIPTQSPTHTPTSRQLSIASIVGIAIGSIAAVILIVLCLLFALGFRVQRATWRRHSQRTEMPQPKYERPSAVSAPGGPHGKAELPDADYLRRLERLHDGAKPELEGSRARRTVWEFFSIRSVSRSSPRQIPTELATKPPTPGPYELPSADILQSHSEEPRTASDAS